jgi:hypothetical protein
MSTSLQITVQLNADLNNVLFFKNLATTVVLDLDGSQEMIVISGDILTQSATISKTLNPGTHNISIFIPGSQLDYIGPGLQFPVKLGKVSFLFNSVPAVLKSAALFLKPVGTGLLLVSQKIKF